MDHNNSLNYEKFLVSRPLFAKFEYTKFGIPIMWETKLKLINAQRVDILSIKNLNAKTNCANKIIECFSFDYYLDSLWRNPFSKTHYLRNSVAILTPDFSISPEMKEAEVIYNTYKNRWMGCFYQQFGIDVVPTVSWAEKWTYRICSLGIKNGNPIAVSTIGIKDKSMFLNGYNYFLKKIKPKYILCFGKMIKGMKGNIICFDYEEAFMPNKFYEQLKLFECSRLISINKEVH